MHADELSGVERMQALRERNIEQRVRWAVGEMLAEGKIPSFYQVAERAKVARSTLYRKPELRVLVEEARRDAVAVPGELAPPGGCAASGELAPSGGCAASGELALSSMSMASGAPPKVSALSCNKLMQENCRLKKEVKSLGAQRDSLVAKLQGTAQLNRHPQITYYITSLSSSL